jgi:hypothetical protein
VTATLRAIAIHCCPRCGFTPVEGMRRYLHIHGEDAHCINPRCGKRFAWWVR